ncbi:leukocyte elastase inhibitor-like [Anolis carolinensis]|uniref:leukocyte elastase inhibitor-like n=1 Tax=Anolis carolinensis TaxID=28377 RepID=UPI0002C88675
MTDQVASANSHFALDLFQKLSEADSTGNIFSSPLSMTPAPAMVFLEAKGDTATQLLKTFHFDGVEDFHLRLQALSITVNQSNVPYVLKLANRLYGENTYTFLQDYLTRTQKLYGAELSMVDFLNVAESMRKQINQWFESWTESKISEVLSEGSVNQLTKLVLVNEIYFKVAGKRSFKKKLGSARRKKKNVKMMLMKKKFPFGYIAECKCRVLELPYQGKELSMILLLPNDIDDSTGLEQLKKQFTLGKLQEWTQPRNIYSCNEIYVHLSKFELEESYDLKTYLAVVDCRVSFDADKEHLSGMLGTHDLHVSKIVHMSFVEVNEEGTEAAATAVAVI